MGRRNLSCVASEQKLKGYLLSTDHRLGRAKASFFASFGFHLEKWEVLARALEKHARDATLISELETEFGTKYIFEGAIETPSQKQPLIRSVWILSDGATALALVTAFPVRSRSNDKRT
jgi:hypothetical protein